MTIKPLSAQGFKPSRVQGLLHSWARLVFRLFSSLSRLPWLFCIRSNRRSIRNSQFEIRNAVRLFSRAPALPGSHALVFSPAPLLPCSRALLFLFSLAPLLPCSPSAVHAQPGWDPEQQVTSIRGAAVSPRVAAVGDTIHLVFWETALDSQGVYQECYYLCSTDAGTTWGLPVMISPRDSISSVNPCVVVSGQVVHIIWSDMGGAPAPHYIRYRRSMDGGRTWGQVDTIFRDAGTSNWISLSGDTVYIVAVKAFASGAYFAKSTDAGASWSPRQLISSVGVGGFRISSFNRIIHIVRERSAPSDVVYLRSTDAGLTWEADTAISEVDSFISVDPALALDRQGNPHATWCDWKYSPYPWTGDIFHRTGVDSGVNWGVIDSLTVLHRAYTSDILAVRDTLHLAWEDERDDPGSVYPEVYYRMSANLGLSWGPEYRLTYARRASRNPSLTVTYNYLHLFWADDRDTTVGQVIYHRRKSRLVGVEEKGSVIRTLKDLRLLLVVSPNPASEVCLISFGARLSTEAVVKVYDILGREMRRIRVKETDRVSWDLTDDKGKEVRNGVYYVQVESGGAVSVKRKLTVLRKSHSRN